MDIKSLTIKNTLTGFKKGDFSPEELRKEFLDLIKKENPKLNAYLEIFDERDTNMRIHANDTNGLSGVPCAIKDNLLIENTRCTAGSKILENYVSTYDAAAIKKLRDAGAIFLGKTNLDEFAMGSSTENSAFGPTKNPHDLTRVPGGSSGGSAAAVASGLAVFALGSDTGGSIRQPASFSGVVGLKPTYGRISRYGLIAMASSLDQIGPITKNVYDAALVLNIIAGEDGFDSTAVSKKVPDYTYNLDKPINGLKIGVPKEYFAEGLDAKVAEKVKEAITKLQLLGAEILDISLPHSEYALAAYYIIMPSEVSANLARYDGIKYGYSKGGKNLLDTYLKSRGEGFGEEARRRIMLGTYALSSGYYEAYYLKAQKVRTLIKQDFDRAFEKVDPVRGRGTLRALAASNGVDVIVGPTAPSTAFKLGEKIDDPLSMYLSDVYTVAVNLAGLPGISIPCGLADGLPVGFQIIGNQFEEEKILQVAYNLEKALK